MSAIYAAIVVISIVALIGGLLFSYVYDIACGIAGKELDVAWINGKGEVKVIKNW